MVDELLQRAQRASRTVRRNAAARKLGIPAYRLVMRGRGLVGGGRLLINSMPKSGTHLVASQVAQLPRLRYSGIVLTQDRYAEAPIGKGGRENYDPAELARAIRRVPRGSFANGHLVYDPVTESILRSSAIPVVHIVRDPRDALVSLVHYIEAFKSHPRHSELMQQFPDREGRLRALLRGYGPSDYGPGIDSFPDRVRMFSPWGKVLPTVKYESFSTAGPEREFSQNLILRQLGYFPRPELREAMDKGVGNGWSATFREGASQQWRRDLSAELQDEIETDLSSVVFELGY